MNDCVFGHKRDRDFNYVDDNNTTWEKYWDQIFRSERTKKHLNKCGDNLFSDTGELRRGIKTSCFECLILGLRAEAYLRRLPDG